MASDRTVDSYYDEVQGVQLLNAELEQRLFAAYRTCAKCARKYTEGAVQSTCPSCKAPRDLRAREQLVEGALRFVVKVARDYARRAKGERHGEESLLTLISAGNLGLLVAVDRFDTSKGTRFLTYAAWWVREKILEELDNMSVVRVPAYQQKAQRARWKAGGNDAEPPHVTLEPLTETEPAGDDSDDLVALLRYNQDLLTRAIRASKLSVRDQYVVTLAVGLREDPKNLKQIAARTGYPPDKVRTIKRHVLDQLRFTLDDMDVADLSDAL